MRLREFRGAVNRARNVYVSVEIDSSDNGIMWCELAKVAARKLADQCQREGIEEINARVDSKRDLFIEPAEEEAGESGAEEGADECAECTCKEHDGEECLDPDCECPQGHEGDDE